MNRNLLFLLCLVVSTIIIACGNSLNSAQDSLTGIWNVTEIQLYNSTENITEENTEGTFTFESNREALFSFSRNGALQVGSGTWNLSEEDINCGFTKCKMFTLSISGEIYEVEFGDQTSDAHRNATEIRLIQNGSHLSPYSDMIISLNKE